MGHTQTPSMREETVSRKDLFQGRVVKLTLEEVRLPSGRVTQREIVEHRGAVAMVARDGQGHILLVRQFRKPIERELLKIPAGTLEEGEEPEACAHRELREETGYRAGRMRRLTRFFPSPGFLTEELTVFLAEDLAWDPLPAAPDEVIELKGCLLEEALKMIDEGVICDAKSIIGILLVWRELSRQEWG